MTIWKAIGVGLLGISFCWPGQAQTVTRAPSAEEQCMTPEPAERGMPVYPASRLARNEGRNVYVELRFSGPEQAPEVALLQPGINDEFFGAIKAYAQKFRVPCMQSGAAQVKVRMEFNFTPNDGRKVAWSIDEAAEDAERRLAMDRCIQRPSIGVIKFPRFMAEEDRRGMFLVDTTFTAADQPPAIKVLHGGPSEAVYRAVLPYLENQRLPCLNVGESITLRQEFGVFTANSNRPWIKDVDLMGLLGGVKGIRQQRVFFDLNAMSCPFTLAFQLRQPYTKNRVGQVGESQSSRLALIRWLEGLDLDIPERDRESIMMAAPARIKVPCGTLDL